MAVVADAAIRAGAEVIGVIPAALQAKELAHGGLSELFVVRTMHERKAMMADLADAFIALPGGFGTLEEFAEILTWSQLGIQIKPCGLLNIEGFWNGLLQFFDHSVKERFVHPQNRQLILVASTPEEMLRKLDAWTPPAHVEKWLNRAKR